MTDDRSTSNELAATLVVDRLHPPELIAFFQSLPRRVAASIAAVVWPTSTDSADESDAGQDREQGPAPAEDAATSLTAVADAVDQAVDRTESLGFPVDPGVDTNTVHWPALPPAAETQAERIDTGALEVARRLSVLSSTDWSADADLIGDMRHVVVDVSRPLRELERHRDLDAAPDDAEPKAVWVTHFSNGSTPVHEADSSRRTSTSTTSTKISSSSPWGGRHGEQGAISTEASSRSMVR